MPRIRALCHGLSLMLPFAGERGRLMDTYSRAGTSDSGSRREPNACASLQKVSIDRPFGVFWGLARSSERLYRRESTLNTFILIGMPFSQNDFQLLTKTIAFL